MLLVYLFVCSVRVSFYHFSFPLDVGGWLRFVIVALPGLFYNLLSPLELSFQNVAGFWVLPDPHPLIYNCVC